MPSSNHPTQEVLLSFRVYIFPSPQLSIAYLLLTMKALSTEKSSLSNPTVPSCWESYLSLPPVPVIRDDSEGLISRTGPSDTQASQWGCLRSRLIWMEKNNSCIFDWCEDKVNSECQCRHSLCDNRSVTSTVLHFHHIHFDHTNAINLTVVMTCLHFFTSRLILKYGCFCWMFSWWFWIVNINIFCQFSLDS